MEAVRELAHTADVGFEVEASTPARLFELAARGLAEALGAHASDHAGWKEEVFLERPDPERLLVAWLRELLNTAVGRQAVPGRLSVEILDPSALRASVEWVPWASDGPTREIKGITYHGLVVSEDEHGSWHGRVVLDV